MTYAIPDFDVIPDFFDPLDSTMDLFLRALHPIVITDGADEQKREGQRRAAVLIPLINREQGWQVLLTKRPETMPRHPGQISFPGGRIETGERAVEAALRETYEEVGIKPNRVHVIGRLDSFNAVSEFRVTPYVGVVDPAAPIIPCEREVAESFEIPLKFFMNPANHVPRIIEYDGQKVKLWDMPFTDESGKHRHVWGMTAMMLYRLYSRAYVRDFTHPDSF